MRASRQLLVTIVLTVVAVPACAGTGPEASRSMVEIEIEIGDGNRWSAMGGSVEAGWICGEGSHRWIGYRDHDGSPIDFEEATALKRMQPALVLLETQLGCSDGTGAISIAWEPDADDRWIVVGGIGAYSAATGGGHVERTADQRAGRVMLSGEISTG